MRIKRIVAFLLALTMVLSGLYMLAPETQEVQAAETTQSSSNTVEPNEVAEGMLDVKMQTKMNDDGSVSLRLVSSVNGLGYRNVGFEVELDADGNGVLDGSPNEFIKFTTGNVAKRIDASVTGVTYNYSPKVIDTDAEYFVTCTLEKINAKYLNADMYVRAYCKTMGGQVVYGTGRYFNITDATAAKIVNIPVKMDAAPVTDENDNVTDVAVKINGIATTATLENYDVDGYAHVNVAVPDSLTNKTALPSASKVEIGTASAIYRNLESDYTGTPDTSWYTVYEGTNEKEFVIATDADLYGLSELAKNNNFVDKTIYVVSDIDVNDGEADSTKFTPDEGAKLYDWTPIGDSDTSFEGTFDGQNHTISGVYFEPTSPTYAWGLFGTTGDCIVRNLTLANSCMIINSGSIQVQLGSIAGKSSGTFDTVKVAENVYSTHVSSHSDHCTGGIVGQMTGDSGKRAISNCWFDGQLTGQMSVGGILGHASAASSVTMSNCLNSGTIKLNGTKNSIGGLCGEIKTSTMTLEDCLSVGTLSKDSYTCASNGSAIGWIRTNPASDTATDVAVIRNTYALSGSEWQGFATLTGKGQCNVDGEAIAGSSGKVIKPTLSYLETATITGETGYLNMNLDFSVADNYAGYWTATMETPILSSFSSNLNEENKLAVEDVTTARTAWYVDATYEKTDTYILYSMADMLGFASLTDVDFSEKTVQLGADITMNKGTASPTEFTLEEADATLVEWTPRNMAGTFDGDGHTIQGVYLDSDTGNVGLFATVSGTVKNLILQNSYFNCAQTSPKDYGTATYTQALGSIAGTLSGTLDTVYSDAIVNHAGPYAGGLVGVITSAGTANTITNCCYAGQISANSAVGGILGCVANTSATIAHSLNVGKVSGNDVISGICGYAYATADGNVKLTIQDSLNVGRRIATSSTPNYYGAAIGYLRSMDTSQVKECAITENVYVVGYYEDNEQLWQAYVKANSKASVTEGEQTITAANYHFWRLDAVKAKKTTSETMNLSFYPEGQDSGSDGETKTCWWINEEGKIPMLESFEDLLTDVTF